MNGKRYHLSRFAHFIPLDHGFTAVYHAVNLAVVFVGDEVADALKRLREPSRLEEALNHTGEGVGRSRLEQVLRRLLEFRLLIGSETEDLIDYTTAQGLLDSLPIGILYLLLTDRCNLRCPYCFIEEGLPVDYTFTDMTPKIAKAGIDLFAQALSESPTKVPEPTVILYGEEPTLNWRTLVAAVEYIGQLKACGALPSGLNITLNTNAVLISRQRAEFFAQHEVGVSVSLDGPEEVQDQSRPFLSGKGTFAYAIRGLRYLQEAGVEPSISCTITPSNLVILPEVLTWFVQDLHIRGMGFNILLDPELAGIENSAEYVKQASHALLECYRIARQEGIYEDRVMRKVRAFVKGEPYLNDCGGCGQQIVVEPGGMVGVCQGLVGSKAYFTTESAELDPACHPFWCEWRRRSPFSMPQCKDCIALGICGGGCPMKVYKKAGTIWEVDEDFCIHAKITLEWLIKDLLREALRAQVAGGELVV